MENNKEEFTSIGNEIISMAKEDWDATIATQKPTNPLNWETANKIRHRNTERLKEIIEHFGWPTSKEFGYAAFHWAWYIAQHSDHDVEFQEKCLKLIEALPRGEVVLEDLALLTDRVRVNKGLPQIYGTQFYANKHGEREMRPVEDPENLNKRREAMRLDDQYRYRTYGDLQMPQIPGI